MKRIKLFPILLCIPYLVGHLVLWVILKSGLYQHLIEHRLFVAVLLNFFNVRFTQFETLFIIGIFWVIYNLLNREKS